MNTIFYSNYTPIKINLRSIFLDIEKNNRKDSSWCLNYESQLGTERICSFAQVKSPRSSDWIKTRDSQARSLTALLYPSCQFFLRRKRPCQHLLPKWGKGSTAQKTTQLMLQNVMLLQDFMLAFVKPFKMFL